MGYGALPQLVKGSHSEITQILLETNKQLNGALPRLYGVRDYQPVFLKQDDSVTYFWRMQF
jgi:hypothetical protein